MISGVLLDLAGVIYEGERALPGALDAVDQLRHAGLSLRFVTNTTRMTKHMVLQRLARLGFGVTESELFTPAQAAREWLARNDCSPSLLVHPDLAQEFEDDSDRAHRAVVVGDAGEAFHYASLNRAFRELIAGASLIALAKNRSFKDVDGRLSLDCLASCSRLSCLRATGRVFLRRQSNCRDTKTQLDGIVAFTRAADIERLDSACKRRRSPGVSPITSPHEQNFAGSHISWRTAAKHDQLPARERSE